jgi:CHAT domain-containing protein
MHRVVLISLLVIASNLHAQETDYAKSIRYYREGKPDSAGAAAERAIRHYKNTGQPDSVVFSYAQKALVVWDVQSPVDALRVIDTGIVFTNKLPAKHLARVAIYSRKGQVQNQQQAFATAAALFRIAMNAIPSDTLNRHVYFLYNNIAQMYLMQERYAEAGQFAKRAYAINLAVQGKDGIDMPAVLQTLYYISQYGENYNQALVDGLELQRVMQLHYPPDHRSIGIMHNSLGNIYEALLRYEDALYHRQLAVKIQFANYSKAKNNGFSLANAYHNLGNLYSYINEHALAQEYLEKGSILFAQNYGEDGLGMVKIYVGLADNKCKLQLYAASAALFEKAYQLQKQLDPGDHYGVAYVETFYGDLYLEQKLFDKAKAKYESSLANFTRSGTQHTRLALQTKKGLAEALSGLGQHEQALKLSAEVVRDFRKIFPPGNDGIANKLETISEVYFAANNLEKALAYSDSTFNEILAKTSVSRDVGAWLPHLPFSYNSSVYLRHRMEILQAMYRTTNNKDLLAQVLSLADQYGKYIAVHLPAFRTQASLVDLAAVNKQIYGMAIEACWQLSANGADVNIMRKAFEYSEASKAFLLRLAANNLLVDAFNSGKDGISSRDHAFRKRIGELNAQYLNEQQTDSVLHLLTTTIEAYRVFQDSLRHSGNAGLAAKYQITPYSIEEIRKRLLQHDETLLQYAVTENAVFVFLVTQNEFRVHRVDPAVLKNIGQLQRLHALSVAGFREPAFALYTSLVKPVEPFLTKGRLLVVPDADLYHLNFEMLVSDNKAGSFNDMLYLIRRHTISYLLSAASAIQYAEANRWRGNNRALLFAPVFTDEMKSTFRQQISSPAFAGNNDYLYLHRQPFALEAAERIGSLIPNDLFKEYNAQERLFKQRAPAYNILHLGTHAEVNPLMQLHSRFFFAQESPGDTITTDDGYLHVYEIYSLPLKAELAVLTACETGSGQIEKGEGIMSLAHSFMHAGCKSVVMSLWKIDEKTSMEITTAFYKYLSQGNTKSESLRKAKLDLLDSKGSKFAHPYYWAGLTLVGDQEAMFTKRNQGYPAVLMITGLATIVAISFYIIRRKKRKALLT